jgi:hypothetical protein
MIGLFCIQAPSAFAVDDKYEQEVVTHNLEESMSEKKEDDVNLGETGFTDDIPQEILKEAERATEKYAAGEERRENNENRREREVSRKEEVKEGTNKEEDREYKEDKREIDATDSEEATEYVHEWIEERHSDLGQDLLVILGALGSVASIVSVILVVK